MAAEAKAGLRLSQEPGVPSRTPTWVPGPPTLGPSAAAFVRFVSRESDWKWRSQGSDWHPHELAVSQVAALATTPRSWPRGSFYSTDKSSLSGNYIEISTLQFFFFL